MRSLLLHNRFQRKFSFNSGPVQTNVLSFENAYVFVCFRLPSTLKRSKKWWKWGHLKMVLKEEHLRHVLVFMLTSENEDSWKRWRKTIFTIYIFSKLQSVLFLNNTTCTEQSLKTLKFRNRITVHCCLISIYRLISASLRSCKLKNNTLRGYLSVLRR